MKIRGIETEACNGVKITPSILESWAKSLIKSFERDPTDPIHYAMSGDSLVVAIKRLNCPMEIYFTQIVETVELPDEVLNISKSKSLPGKTSNSIYCSCGGPITIVPIFGDMVKVCKTCKKEVR